MTPKPEGMVERVANAELRHCYRDVQGRIWSVEGFWRHPQHRDYHVGWTGDYIIAQEYGNFKNELRMVRVEEWDAAYSLAWEPARVCAFCGFTRMRPCLTRQTCPNLQDYPLEPLSSPQPEG